MKTEALKKRNELRFILLDGRKKHLVFKAIRPTMSSSEPCVNMWQKRQELEKLNK